MGVMKEQAFREAGAADSDPVLDTFLHVLAREIVSHPEKLQGLDAALVERLQGLVGDIDVDLDAALSPDDA